MKTSSITRSLALSALAAGALVAPAHPAIAAAAPQPIAVSYYESCPGFKVLVTADGKVGVIDLPGDRAKIIWPGLTVTLTAKSGESITYEGASGVTHIKPASDGGQYVTATGRNIITVPKANGHPLGVYFTIGTVNWTLNADGTERGGMFTGTGTVVDVCAELAS
ncbi:MULTISPECIES: hypothetical protein [unclassified Pseudarthrobacter]|uniref:hypothetical protein n=1 Tax=unclassified Pseudarthrobacter TaxID=2647000 RepID=UPI001625BBED|nr:MULTISPECIES: hypothetical protein [unclassified Pseudarthrobacter]MBE4717212.1 hypothetical protein [Pseudarthrobacter sp. AB1]QNE13878.1 hypothetical protein FYJ92_05040 [Pseudarthrobacter sp. NBSH8]